MEPGTVGKLRLRALELLEVLQHRADAQDDVEIAVEWKTEESQRYFHSATSTQSGSRARKNKSLKIPTLPDSTGRYAAITADQSAVCIRGLTTPMGSLQSAQVRMQDVHALEIAVKIRVRHHRSLH